MSKKIVMYVLFSIVSSIVAGIGAFGSKSGPEKVILVVQHPDSCFLLEPNPMAAGSSTGADVVSVAPGKAVFKFDCDGKQIQVEKEIRPGQMMCNIDPMGK